MPREAFGAFSESGKFIYQLRFGQIHDQVAVVHLDLFGGVSAVELEPLDGGGQLGLVVRSFGPSQVAVLVGQRLPGLGVLEKRFLGRFHALLDLVDGAHHRRPEDIREFLGAGSEPFLDLPEINRVGLGAALPDFAW